jgi:hypothetical protein
MKFPHVSLILTLTALSTGCVVQSAMTLVPGAAQVKITTSLADIMAAPRSATYPLPTSTFPTSELHRMRQSA